MNLCGAILIAAADDWLGVAGADRVLRHLRAQPVAVGARASPPARNPQRRGPQQGERPLRPRRRRCSAGRARRAATGAAQRRDRAVPEAGRRAARRAPRREAPRTQSRRRSPHPKRRRDRRAKQPVDVAPLRARRLQLGRGLGAKSIWPIAASRSGPNTWPTTSCAPISRWKSICKRRSATSVGTLDDTGAELRHDRYRSRTPSRDDRRAVTGRRRDWPRCWPIRRTCGRRSCSTKSSRGPSIAGRMPADAVAVTQHRSHLAP